MPSAQCEQSLICLHSSPDIPPTPRETPQYLNTTVEAVDWAPSPTYYVIFAQIFLERCQVVKI